MPIDTRITEEAVVELTRDIIECPTPNPPGDEGALVDVLLDRLKESPVDFDIETNEVKPGRPNLIASAGDPDGKRLLLTGHMDTVPAEAEDWSGDPFELRREGDRLIGRGTSDMKASLAAALIAAEDYLSTSDPQGEVVLGFVVDEERGGHGSQAMIDNGMEADAAILGEPTNVDVGIAHKGAVRYDLTVRGRNAHSGRPDRGVNAIEKIRRVVERLEELDEEVRDYQHDLLSPGSTVTVTQIEGGLAPNVVPAKATITVDWRFLPNMPTDPEWYDTKIRDALSDLALDGDPIEVEYDRWEFGHAVETPADEPIVKAVQNAARDVGLDGDLVGFNAGTDARYLVHDGGIPTVLFGPGHIEDDAHTIDEAIRVSDLVATARTYHRTIERFFG